MFCVQSVETSKVCLEPPALCFLSSWGQGGEGVDWVFYYCCCYVVVLNTPSLERQRQGELYLTKYTDKSVSLTPEISN